MYVIGIDIGTGSTKAVAVDYEGKVLITAQVPYPTFTPSHGISEQDPDLILGAFLKCLKRITTALVPQPSAICLSSAMHSVIAVDLSGKPLSRMMTWADNRSSAIAENLLKTPEGKKIYAETGTPLHSMAPVTKLMWLRKNNPGLFASTAKFISIKEFIWYQLFNVFEVDYSIASATGLFNITRLAWDDDALQIAGITEKHLSAPVNTNHLRTGAANAILNETDLKTDTPWIIGASDGCMASVGTFATEPGVAALTIGTSGAIRVASEKPVINHNFMPFNYRLDEKTLISGGPINNGGVALRWYAQNLVKKNLSTGEDYNELIDPAMKVAAGSDGLLFLPYIQGERAPIWDSEACGSFFGIRIQHKQEHFTRAVLEGVCFSLYQICTIIEQSGQRIDQINVSGGFVRSEPWVQILCDVFGKKVLRLNTEDASAIGAAFLAMKTLRIREGYWPMADDEAVIFTPGEDNHSAYRDRFFPLYEAMYPAMVHLMRPAMINERQKSLPD